MYILSIEDNIRAILSTYKNSLILAPDVGIDRDFIDKKLDRANLMRLKEQVSSQILKNEPRISAADIKIEVDNDEVILIIQNLKIGLK